MFDAGGFLADSLLGQDDRPSRPFSGGLPQIGPLEQWKDEFGLDVHVLAQSVAMTLDAIVADLAV